MHFPENLCKGHLGEAQLPWPGQEEQIGDDAVQAVRFLDHGPRIQLFGVASGQLLGEELGESAQGRERISNLVGHTRRHAADGGQFFIAVQLPLKTGQFRAGRESARGAAPIHPSKGVAKFPDAGRPS